MFFIISKFAPLMTSNFGSLKLQANSPPDQNKRLSLLILLLPPFEPWKRIWKSWVPGKCKMLIWLAIQNRYSAADRLEKRGLPHPERCSLCARKLRQSNTYLHLVCLHGASGLQFCNLCIFPAWCQAKETNPVTIWPTGPYGLGDHRSC